MEKEQITGKLDEFKGKAKQGVRKVADDPGLQADGMVDQAKGTMTLETLLEALQDYKAALYKIADHVERQKALERYQKSIGAAWDAKEDSRAFAYKKIAFIVEGVLQRHTNEPPAVASNNTSVTARSATAARYKRTSNRIYAMVIEVRA